MELAGRITTASNATFLGHIGTGDDTTAVVYKPVRGEKPLWDFPDHTLAHREVAAYLVSEATGWNIVPTTWLGEGRFGTGMLQLWQDADPGQDPVDLVPAGEIPPGFHHVLDGYDADDVAVSVIHEDSPALRRMAVFDVLVNNADRKGAHILPMADGHRYGVDHGVTFHTEPRLRTVLWGWIGQPLTGEELTGVTAVRDGLEADLGEALAEHLSPAELHALRRRCDDLSETGVFPGPAGDMPAVPWPVF
ncbi:SCO1664 family protein [Corynebacterium variabile]|uniref:SCO1664 family protein n=1 Tax=Corynebacterium variabile TaxID=1727 RepID=UPI002897E127|nr:SCO1664 family protein [Corynebacterium variabile]